MLVLVVAAVLLAAVLAGCSGEKEADVDSALEVDPNSPNVTFNVTGSDSDNDTLTWTLTLGNTTLGNGTSLPGNVTHKFVEAGNFSVVLNVTDGTNSTTATVTIAVTAGNVTVGALTDPTRCDRTPTQTAGPIYVFQGDGGDWAFVEDNGMPGLQVANNHPGGGPFHNPAWADCQNGDLQML